MSIDTENKLARAAKSAQRLAQLSDVARDDRTGDLFVDDPGHAAIEAMNIDTRQGTLSGFELPDEVLVAIGMPPAELTDAAAGEAEAVSPPVTIADAKGPRNARGARSSGASAGPAGAAVESPAAAAKAPDTTPASSGASALDAVLAPASAAMASATRSVAHARRQSAARPGEGTSSGNPRAVDAQTQPVAASAPGASTQASSTQTSLPPDAPQPDVPQQDAQPAAAGTASAPDAPAAAGTASASDAPAAAASGAAPAQPKPFAREAAPYVPAAARRAPDLDWARATAFADTVDALYGVIADQRRAAGDHSRRMKWLLSTVVGALLVTIAIGITQTALLMRLTRESAAQQQRIEDMLRTQQATLTALADAAASANARSPANDGAQAAPVAPAAHQAPQASAAAKHVKPQHPHKPGKPATAH
ncbi:hypothetical protein [Trinickia terrae]|uniref:hypothetical protein n=1 Tax=Trinickia terrae TaxID=2571161 RepID=UPI0034E2848C